jgi:hypothetical protein
MKAPIEMPTQRVAAQQFELQRVDYASPEASGRIGGVQAGFPLWAAIYTLTNQEVSESDVWRAFLLQTRGATRRILCHDLKREYPLAYTSFDGMTRSGGGAFDGTATSWSESINSDGDSRITLGGLPASFVMNIGDYIGFRWTATDDEVAGLTWHAPVRAIEAKTASSGTITNITCEPPVPSAVPNTATAYLVRASAVMALVTDQTSLEPIDVRGAISGGTIVGIQDIRG